MTLHELEETLHTLVERHPGLDESMLVTLLRAGGWEEKNIEEARMLFRSGNKPTPQNKPVLPTLQEDPVLPPVADADHLLEDEAHMMEREKEEPAVPVSQEPKQQVSQSVPEPQSLVQPVAPLQREELPHNLPLRPFETSEHVWPFSRYRDVFYGEPEAAAVPEVVAQPVQEKPEEPKEKPIQINQPVPVFTRPQPEVSLPEMERTETPRPQTAHSKGDEKLVMLASFMLLVILLLLGYMYGNGRL